MSIVVVTQMDKENQTFDFRDVAMGEMFESNGRLYIKSGRDSGLNLETGQTLMAGQDRPVSRVSVEIRFKKL